MARRNSSINIYDVAERAGVSKSTVSRVLNGSDRVSDPTRQAVERAISEVDFRPNTAARRLAGSANRRIGLLLPFFGSMFSSFYVYEVIRGVGEVVSERDAELLLHFQHAGANTPSVEQRLTANGALGGWVIADEHIPDGVLRKLQSAGIPAVILNRASARPGISWAAVDNAAGARCATEHLIRLGHTRIATVAGALEQPPGRERLDGFLEAMREHGLEVPDAWIAPCDFQQQLAAEAAIRMLSCPSPPTAIFAASDLMAAGVYEAAASMGIAIPAGLSVVGFDDDFLASQLAPKLTTVRQPLSEAARAAAGWLLDHLEQRNGHQLKLRLPAQVVSRDSCAAPAACEPTEAPQHTPNKAGKTQ